MLAKNFLHGVSGELRITSALSILGGHRMALGCSGLHANGCFNACRNCPAPKNLCRNSPALPYYVVAAWICVALGGSPATIFALFPESLFKCLTTCGLRF